jgi:hypothetical protein
MIYTIGHTDSYEQYFKEYVTPEKLGRTSDYPGGSVWKTPEEAQKSCPNNYSVYGVDADWEKDTEASKSENWHDLIKTATLIKLNSITET